MEKDSIILNAKVGLIYRFFKLEKTPIKYFYKQYTYYLLNNLDDVAMHQT